MTLEINATLTATQTIVDLIEQPVTQLLIEQTPANTTAFAHSALLLGFAQQQLQQIEQLSPLETASTDQVDTGIWITMDPEWTEQIGYVGQLLAEQNQPPITSTSLPSNVSQNFRTTLAPAVEAIILVLSRFGYPLTKSAPVKAKPAKTRHRWTKAVSQIEFTVATREAQGTAIWQKRKEMLLKAGAQLWPTAPLNKDGSFGFAAKMGTHLRNEHAAQIQDNQTTEDIIFKSVNEIGLFLYFGGTNSWLELCDTNSRSIDDWTKI